MSRKIVRDGGLRFDSSDLKLRRDACFYHFKRIRCSKLENDYEKIALDRFLIKLEICLSAFLSFFFFFFFLNPINTDANRIIPK